MINRAELETSFQSQRGEGGNKNRKATTVRELEYVADTPKLRETNSTKCQSPKASSAFQRSKVESFKRIRLLGRGKFGDVYLVK